MDIQRLQYTKNWNSSTDFPTLETSETQVRADQQLLYDEIKEYLNNTLCPAIEDQQEDTGQRMDELGKGIQGLEDNKVPKTTRVNGHPLSDDIEITPDDIGLGNVDNTADSQKPVSVAQQEALDKKADKSELQGILLGQIPDHSITPEKMDPSFFGYIMDVQVIYNGGEI